MIIGFTERRQTVSEDEVPEGDDTVRLQVNVATLRISEREHQMIFRVLESISTAIVEPLTPANQDFDALFGFRDNTDDPITGEFSLFPGEMSVSPLSIFIINDFVPEDDECFTIRILAADIPGRRELFSCGEHDNNYHCEHTICIVDDDGKFLVVCNLLDPSFLYFSSF